MSGFFSSAARSILKSSSYFRQSIENWFKTKSDSKNKKETLRYIDTSLKKIENYQHILRNKKNSSSPDHSTFIYEIRNEISQLKTAKNRLNNFKDEIIANRPNQLTRTDSMFFKNVARETNKLGKIKPTRSVESISSYVRKIF